MGELLNSQFKALGQDSDIKLKILDLTDYGDKKLLSDALIDHFELPLISDLID